MGIRDWFKPKDNTAKISIDANETRISLHLKVEWEPIDIVPELSFLFIRVSEQDLHGALGSWRWLPLTNLTIFAVSAFGEAFLRNTSGEIFHMDTIEGQLLRVANSMSEFFELLQAEEVQNKLLLAGFVIGARSRGMILEEGECYDFKIAPILGGPMEATQIEKTSFIVKLDIAGQIHEQIKALPPGTEISEIVIKN